MTEDQEAFQARLVAWGSQILEEKTRLERELAEAKAQLASRPEVGRILLGSDAYCPKCGHNRYTSAVCSIDNEDGTHSCQLCEANWQERIDMNNALAPKPDERKEG